MSEIKPELLLQAYAVGVFPMAEGRDDPRIYLLDPDERGVIPLDGLHIPRSLKKTVRQDVYEIRYDTAFEAVVEGCAAPAPGREETWINDGILSLYRELYQLGFAHSVECWQDGELVGGLYGVAFDRVFCGESMFSRTSDASKVALAWLVAALREAGYAVLDCQFMTEHLGRMGAVPLPQAQYMAAVAQAGGQAAASLPAVVAGFGASSSPGKAIVHSLTHTS